MTQPVLFDAIAAGDTGRVEGLLAHEPELAGARSETGVSAVLWALYHGQEVLARNLAQRASGLDIHDLAALGLAGDIARRLEEDPADLSRWSADGFQPVHLSAFFARQEALKVLIERGADVNVRAQHPAGMAPIHSAAASRRAETVAILLAAGAGPDAVQAGGFTALMSAAAHGLTDMADALLAAGADVTIRAEDGRAAADLAREGEHADLAARLETPG